MSEIYFCFFSHELEEKISTNLTSVIKYGAGVKMQLG